MTSELSSRWPSWCSWLSIDWSASSSAAILVPCRLSRTSTLRNRIQLKITNNLRSERTRVPSQILNSHNSRQIRVWMCEKLIKGNKKTRYRFFAPATAVNRTTKIQHPLLFNLQIKPNQILILIVPMKVETGQEARVRAGGTPWTPGCRLRWQPNKHDKFRHIYKLTLIARETLRTFIKFQRNKYFP